MESTPGKRLQQWREFKGLSITEVFRLTGIKVTTLSTAEQPGANNPSYDTITKLLNAFPDLNPDWLLLGSGPMLRDGRTLTAVVVPADPPATKEPSPDYTSAAATQQTLYIDLLKEQIADLKADKVRNLAEIDRLLKVGKFDDSSDAADDLEEGDPTLDPIGPLGRGVRPMLRNKIGYQPSFMK